MKDVSNPKGLDAIIYSTNEKGDLSGVFPDEIEKGKGRSTQWLVAIWNNPITVTFQTDSPFDWKKQKSDKNGRIVGVIRGNAKETVYKYTLTDSQGNEIDPRLRVGKG